RLTTLQPLIISPEVTAAIQDHANYQGSDKHQVIAWRLIKNSTQIPQRDWENGGYSAMWYDGHQLRRIYAEAFRETWSQQDPELLEREYLPKEKRKELLILWSPKTPTFAPVPSPPVDD